MAIVTINLISPDNAAVVGALLENGSTCKIEVIYDTVTTHIDTILDHGGALKFSQENGEINCIDLNGNVWSIHLVIDYSLGLLKKV